MHGKHGIFYLISYRLHRFFYWCPVKNNVIAEHLNIILSVAPTALIYKYNISSGVYTPACDIPLLRSLFLPDTNKISLIALFYSQISLLRSLFLLDTNESVLCTLYSVICHLYSVLCILITPTLTWYPLLSKI